MGKHPITCYPCVNANDIIEGDFISCPQKVTIGDKIGIGLVADWLRFPKIARSSAHYFLT